MVTMGILEFMGAVVLLSWFFGVSYGAVLHGMLNFMIWAIVIGAILCVIAYLFSPVPIDNPNTIPKQQKKVTRPVKEHPVARKIAGGVAFFIISYLMTDLILVILGIWEVPHLSPAHIVLVFLLPAFPFLVVVAYRLIQKMCKKKRAQK